MFCPKCGSILRPVEKKGKKVFGCSCGYVADKDQKFEVKEKGARKGRNPATGGELLLPPRKVVTFKISGKLKERLNEGAARKRR